MYAHRLVQLEDVKVPTPQSTLNTLPITTWTAADTPDKDGHSAAGFTDGTCSVCLVDYEAGDRVMHLPCKHAFHEECGKKWLGQYSKLCPTCRAPVCS